MKPFGVSIWSSTCPKHPEFNPETPPELILCEGCSALFDFYQSVVSLKKEREALRTILDELDERKKVVQEKRKQAERAEAIEKAEYERVLREAEQVAISLNPSSASLNAMFRAAGERSWHKPNYNPTRSEKLAIFAKVYGIVKAGYKPIAADLAVRAFGLDGRPAVTKTTELAKLFNVPSSGVDYRLGRVLNGLNRGVRILELNMEESNAKA